MSGLGGRSRDTSKAATLGPYPDDGARRMPTSTSSTATEAARTKRLEVSARGGRTSTRLAGMPGTRAFVNTFLGGTS